MPKNLDGIKKLSFDEVKKYRKIVLNFIGGKEAAGGKITRNTNQTASASKKVDGIKISQAGTLKLDNQKKFDHNKSEKMQQTNESGRLREAVRRQAEERQRIKDEEKQYLLKKEQAEKERQEAEERLRQEELKKKEIARQIAEEERKIKRQKALKKFKKELGLKINEIFLKIRRNLGYLVIYIITFLAIFYIVFCLIILRFNFNSDIIKAAVNYLPVPAVITNRGIIYYNDFSNIKDRKFTNLNYKGEKDNLIKWVVLRNLEKKFSLTQEATEAEIAVKFVMSEEFNQVGIFRIKKIKDLLIKGGELEYLSKYADDYNNGAYYTPDKLAEKFGSSAKNLAVGQISEVLPLADGYYIIQRISDKDGETGVKFIFIGARTLEQYLKDQLVGSKVFILAN